MNRIYHIFVFIALFLFIIQKPLQAQTPNTFPENYKRNVIKWNLTPFLLWSKKNINISYERVLSPHRSFSINAGYFEMPTIGLLDSLNIKNTKNRGGFSVSGDYRFYFKNRNKNFAPDGLFWGIYSSIHYYKFDNDVEIIDNDNVKGRLQLAGGFNIIGVGVELGYQFAIKKRWTIDLIFMGPSLSMYGTKMKLTGDLSGSNEDYLEAIRDMLVSKFPGFDKLINTGEFNDKGVSTSLGFGLRYMIQIGYRF